MSMLTSLLAPGNATTAAVGGIATRSTNQTIPNATVTAVTFDTEAFDSSSFFAIGSPTRLTVPAGEDGIYTASGIADFASNATGSRSIHIRANGATYLAIDTRGAIASSLRASTTVTLPLVAGDYIEFLLFQDSGGDLLLNAGTFKPRMSLIKNGTT